jgi:hypothetical protein
MFTRILIPLCMFPRLGTFIIARFLKEPGNADPAIILKKTGCIISMNAKPGCRKTRTGASSGI